MVIFIFALTFSSFPMEDEKIKMGIAFSISFRYSSGGFDLSYV